MAKAGRPKGHPKTGGRQKGIGNHVTTEARAVCSRIIENPLYLATLEARAQAGTLPPALETMLWAYAKGKPVEQIAVTSTHTEVSIAAEAADLTTEQLEAIVRMYDQIDALKAGAKPVLHGHFRPAETDD